MIHDEETELLKENMKIILKEFMYDFCDDFDIEIIEKQLFDYCDEWVDANIDYEDVETDAED